jgi:hypothetical protein
MKREELRAASLDVLWEVRDSIVTRINPLEHCELDGSPDQVTTLTEELKLLNCLVEKRRSAPRLKHLMFRWPPNG